MRHLHAPRLRRTAAMAFLALGIPAALSASTAMDRFKECFNEALTEAGECMDRAGFWGDAVCQAEYSINAVVCEASLVRDLLPL